MYYYRLISSMLKAVISSLGTGLYAVYKGESNALASLTTSLYAIYKAESNANDSLGVYNGTAQGGLTYTTGKSGNAFVGNGTNASVNLPNNALNLTGNFSVSCWIKVPSITGGLKAIVSNNKLLLSPTRQYGWGCYINNSTVLFQKYDGSGTSLQLYYDLLSAFTANTWHLFTFTYSTSAGRKIYFNSSLVASDSNVTAIAYDTTHYPTLLAQRYDGTNYEYFNSASLDELNIWNKELTATEITELYNSGNGKFYQGNAFYSTIVNDSLGTYNGTAQGGLTYTAGKSGNAFTFNGTNAYVSLPNNMFNSFTGDFSINMWVNIVNTGYNQTLLSAYTFNGVTFNGIGLTNYGYTKFQIFDGTAMPITLQESLVNPYNTWYMVTVTRKASTGTKIYYNGTLSTSNTNTTNPVFHPTLATKCAIGALDYSTSFGGIYYYCANGTKIDELNTWTKELTATEVTELYNAGTGKFYPTF